MKKFISEAWREKSPHAFSVFREKILPTLKELKQDGKKIYPAPNDTFKAFNLTPYDDVKVVILGQDPYHNCDAKGIPAASGLCFQVNGKKLNPSLKNIMKKLEVDSQPDFNSWASQGVLLMNTALTVQEKLPASHTKLWRPFTEAILQSLNKRDSIIYICWGSKAHELVSKYIDNPTAYKIISSHPSPFSADKPFRSFPSFRDSTPFKDCNLILSKLTPTSNIDF